MSILVWQSYTAFMKSKHHRLFISPHCSFQFAIINLNFRNTKCWPYYCTALLLEKRHLIKQKPSFPTEILRITTYLDASDTFSYITYFIQHHCMIYVRFLQRKYLRAISVVININQFNFELFVSHGVAFWNWGNH